MTDPNKTSITVVLDKSGSMNSVRDDTIGGYNIFIESQKSLPGECDISLIQFNEKNEFTYKSKNIKDITQNLTREQYVPNGNTALLDAVGKAITEKGQELSDLPEEQRPSKVLFVILTDGKENCSRIYDNAKIKEMIEHQKTVYSWDFTFLGANIDTFAVAGGLGIAPDKSLSFSTSKPGGMTRGLRSMSNYASQTRLSKSASDVKYSSQDIKDNS